MNKELTPEEWEDLIHLAGVWRSEMSDELWRRVTDALGDQERYPN